MTAVTLTQAIAWMRSSVGQFWNPDHAHGYQCKDWADAFCLFLFQSWVDTIRPGNGADVFDNANPDYFVKVRNDPSRPDQVPPPGSIVSIAGSAAVPEGHVAGVLYADQGGMNVVQMNGYTQEAAHLAHLPYDGLIGWLIPKYAPEPNTTKEDGPMFTIHDWMQYPAYTNGPTNSEVLKELHEFLQAAKELPKQTNALHEAVFNNDGTNESILGGFSISGLDNHNAAKILTAVESIQESLAAIPVATVERAE